MKGNRYIQQYVKLDKGSLIILNIPIAPVRHQATNNGLSSMNFEKQYFKSL